MFLEISQNPQENACARVSFLIKLQAQALFERLLLRKDSQKVNKQNNHSSKNNQSSKRLQSFDEYIFIAFQKFYGN